VFGDKCYDRGNNPHRYTRGRKFYTEDGLTSTN